MSAIFFSDIHLEDGHCEKTRKFIHFLETEVSKFKKVYILGDLFDVWPKTNAYLKSHYAPVLLALRELASAGVEVSYIEGNHDFNLGSFFPALGIKTYRSEIRMELSGKKALLLHGDLENRSEKAYRAFRALVRTRIFNLFLATLPGKFVYRVGHWMSHSSRSMNKMEDGLKEKIRNTYHQAATHHFSNGTDIVIHGHIHLPEICPLKDEKLFINTGDWLTHFTYVTFENDQFSLRTF